MKLLRFLRSTEKQGLRILLVSLLFLFFLSCASSPPYTRENIEKIISNISYQEFGIKAESWLVGETLWVYVPFGRILDAQGAPTAEFTENSRRIFLTLQRTFLNMDNPPKFYAFVLSDKKYDGLYLYRVGFVPDQVKFGMGLISLEQISERTVSLIYQKEQILLNGRGYIKRHDLTEGEFIGYLARQELINIYLFSGHKDVVEVKDIKSYFQQGRLTIDFDIQIVEPPRELPEPFLKAKEAVKKYLKIYEKPDQIIEIEFIDNFNNRQSTYTQAALLD